MFIKNKILNFYIMIQIKVYKKVKLLLPSLGENIERNIQKNVKNNFVEILSKTKKARM